MTATTLDREINLARLATTALTEKNLHHYMNKFDKLGKVYNSSCANENLGWKSFYLSFDWFMLDY